MEALEKKQTVLIENRKNLTIDGINNVESFTEYYMDLSSVFGRIEIEGENLKIEELRQDTGKIYITGEINGIFYKENKKTKKGFGKGFK